MPMKSIYNKISKKQKILLNIAKNVKTTKISLIFLLISLKGQLKIDWLRIKLVGFKKKIS
jgi:hypothetical protein